MATVSGFTIYCSRLRIGNLRRFANNYCTNRPINRASIKSNKYWCYLLGGSVFTGAIAIYEWQRLNSVHALNPKKIKVSKALNEDDNIMHSSKCMREWFLSKWIRFIFYNNNCKNQDRPRRKVLTPKRWCRFRSKPLQWEHFHPSACYMEIRTKCDFDEQNVSVSNYVLRKSGENL